MTGDKGFTLVELMVVVAIMIVLSLVAVPGSRNWLSSQRSRRAVMELFTNIKKARTRAITENNNYVIVFNIVNDTYRIFDDDNNNGVLDAGEVDMIPGGIMNLGNVDLTAVQINLAAGGTGTTVVLRPDGIFIDGLGGTILLNTPEGRAYTITLNGSTGRIRLT